MSFVRTVYPDFVHRFIIIKPKEVHECGADLKQGTKVILESIKEMDDKWRLGHTKVFFRAGGKIKIEECIISYLIIIWKAKLISMT